MVEVNGWPMDVVRVPISCDSGGEGCGEGGDGDEQSGHGGERHAHSAGHGRGGGGQAGGLAALAEGLAYYVLIDALDADAARGQVHAAVAALYGSDPDQHVGRPPGPPGPAAAASAHPS